MLVFMYTFRMCILNLHIKYTLTFLFYFYTPIKFTTMYKVFGDLLSLVLHLVHRLVYLKRGS